MKTIKSHDLNLSTLTDWVRELNINAVLLVFMTLFFSGTINASSTGNEFESCKKIAVSILEHCLKGGDDGCWLESKTRYDACRREVIKQHSPDDDRIRAEKKRRDELGRP